MTQLTWQKFPAAVLSRDSALQTAWNQLNADRADVPFLCAEVIAPAIGLLGTGKELLLVGSIEQAPVAMFVLVPVPPLRWATFQPSQLPLAPWVAARSQDLNDLCRSLMRGPLWPCLALSITQVDPHLTERVPDDNDNWHSDYIDTAWLDVHGSFEDYWAQRGKNLRQNMRKQRNKLAAEGTKTQLRIMRAPAEMAPAVGRYGALESSGWKAEAGTAIHPDNQQGRFYVRLFEDAAQRGEAVIFEYLFGDRPAAINLCLLRAHTLVVLKTTYDESIPNALSPAFLLRQEELEYIFSSTEIRRIEYYGRRMDWHTKLTDDFRTLYHLTVYRWPWIKRLAMRRRATRQLLREESAPQPATTAGSTAQASSVSGQTIQ